MNILEENTMFENLVEVLKANPRKIVYTSGRRTSFNCLICR